MQRRLQLTILGHVWVLVPLALLWLSRPDWRGPMAPTEVRGLGALVTVATLYLLLRTWLTLAGRFGTARTWPYFDIAFVAAALFALRSPTDPLSMMYFIPLASAVASLDRRHLAFVTAAAGGSYLVVIVTARTPWSIGLAYRAVFVLLMASLYAAVIRLVTEYARAAERAEYQTALAREIHDGIQHFLVTMGARLELARGLVREDPVRAERIVGEERATLRAAADELRYLVRRLRAAPGMDLAAALRGQLAASAGRWPFALEIAVPEQLPRLRADAEHALLRAIQEGLTNAAKHAEAATVEVAVTVSGGEVRCQVRDDGVGFAPGGAAEGGLQGLRARVREAGGRLEVASRPGGGTTLTVAFPLPVGARP
ncbi:MAG TPA: sensor histidine kinase [bacterium]|nr:sensor histidine kinase [bacterium]